MSQDTILLIWDRIGDYHLSRVKACEKLLGAPVFTADLAGTDNLYKWDSIAKTTHTVLSSKPAEQSDIWNRFRTFRRIIKTHSIAVVAMPYGRTEYHIFLLYARLKGIRTIIFSESWYSRGKLKDFLKSLLLKSLGNYFFVSGKRAFDHFTKNYKINPEKIETGYSVVDNNHFQRRLFTEKKYVLTIARYSEEKNLSFLIDSYAKSLISNTYNLMLVGEGPLRPALQSQIDILGLSDRVQLAGWVPYAALPKAYAEAVVFVLPSSFEPWGLVVNEAMSAGLPILVSDACGCMPELVAEGVNGWSFNSNTQQELIERLNAFAALSEKGIEITGKNSMQLIRNYTPDTWAGSIARLAQAGR